MATYLKNLSEFSTDSIPTAKGYRFGVVVSEWNIEITKELWKGTERTLIKSGCDPKDIFVIHVPGSFELTLGAQQLAEIGTFDAIICLGCVIKGETPHFDFICQATANGINNVNIKYNIPTIFGVITTNTLQQAIDRSGGKHGNKGDEAAITAIKMAVLQKKIIELNKT